MTLLPKLAFFALGLLRGAHSGLLHRVLPWPRDCHRQPIGYPGRKQPNRAGVVSGGVQRQAATGCGRYICTVRSRITVAWDVRAPLHASFRSQVCVSVGMLWSCTMSDRATVVRSKSRRNSKEFQESLQPGRIEQAKDDSRKVRQGLHVP